METTLNKEENEFCRRLDESSCYGMDSPPAFFDPGSDLNFEAPHGGLV